MIVCVSSETLVSLSVSSVVNTGIGSNLSLVTVGFPLGLALSTFEARVVLGSNSDEVTELEVLDLRTYSDDGSDDFVPDHLCIKIRQERRKISLDLKHGSARRRVDISNARGYWVSNHPEDITCKSEAQTPQYMILMSTLEGDKWKDRLAQFLES